MASEKDERLATEITLLESMYPEASFNEKSRELNYTIHGASLCLRLPDGYLVDSLPEVLSASSGKQDLRNAIKESISNQALGEEVLDSIILSFTEIAEQRLAKQSNGDDTYQAPSENEQKTTIIVYLHHLLNTNKRKMCLSPSNASISGVTKPGYPGVLVYSGPSRAVHEHVNELKALNWQAFQVRSELEGEEWVYKHGKGMLEVESMGDIVGEVDVREGRKEVFMEAMRMK